MAGFVARRARTIVEVFAWKTISTVVVVGSAASIAGIVAWRADICAEEIGVFLDQGVTILACSSWAASSGAVALAVTVAFKDVGLVEDVIVGDAIGWDTSAELQEVGWDTRGTVGVAWAIAGQTCAVARLTLAIGVVVEAIVSVARFLAFTVGGQVETVWASLAVVGVSTNAGLACIVARKTVQMVEVIEAIADIARHDAGSVDESFSVVAGGTIVISCAVAGKARVITRQAGAVRQEFVLETSPTVAGARTSAGDTGWVAMRADSISEVGGEGCGEVETVVAFTIGRASSGTVAITVSLASAEDIFLEAEVLGNAIQGEAFAVVVLEVTIRAGFAVEGRGTVAGGTILVARQAGTVFLVETVF